MTAYYNEIEPFAAQWLRNLIAGGLIAPGDVDDRSIRDVRPDDVRGYTQCHFFAGIGIWSHALRQAGWPDDRAVWTGSCPCQPFSKAGKGRGFDDERHLWPDWWRLIRECRPTAIFGEQVDGEDGELWLDLVSADLESGNYTFAPTILCSAGFGAPNIRHRFFWLAHPNQHGCVEGWRDHAEAGYDLLGCGGADGGMGDTSRVRSSARSREPDAGYGEDQPQRPSDASGVADTERHGWRAEWHDHGPDDRTILNSDGAFSCLGDASDAGLPHAESLHAAGTRRWGEGRATQQPSGPPDPWRELEWIGCVDGKARPTQPGLFPLAPRRPGDVGILRAAGNAINAVVAREFIVAAMECLP